MFRFIKLLQGLTEAETHIVYLSYFLQCQIQVYFYNMTLHTIKYR